MSKVDPTAPRIPTSVISPVNIGAATANVPAKKPNTTEILCCSSIVYFI